MFTKKLLIQALLLVAPTSLEVFASSISLPFKPDAFEKVQNEVVLTQAEVQEMLGDSQKVEGYLQQHLDKDEEYLKQNDMDNWEINMNTANQFGNLLKNWKFFWDSLTAERDENDKPFLPEKNSKLYNLIKDSFGDYEQLREMYLQTAGVKPEEFKRGERKEATKDPRTKGWLWLLYNSETNKLEVTKTLVSETYLDGRGNGLQHPLLNLDIALACTVENIHVVINWKKVTERLDEILNREYVLVTGGLGYIGSHTLVELVGQENEHVVIIDNFDNSKLISLNRVKWITKKPDHFVFHQVDLRNSEELEQKIFKRYKIKSVIHFAALKAVGESMKKPLEYYHNNVGSTIKLLMLMRDYNVTTMVFSSSATVYGDNPLSDENSAIQPINPYGQTKAMMEQIMKDYAESNPSAIMIALRYFNPIGAHKSGLIGEDPNDIPNNLMPYIQKVASGHLPFLRVFGNDYDTPDGTGVRDYIHVTDLAQGHTAALKKQHKLSGYEVFNLGTGSGTTVLQMKDAFEKASGKTIKHEIHPRRAGDARQVLAIPDRANKVLEWKTHLTVMDACRDSFRWVKQNPDGYVEKQFTAGSEDL